MAAEKKLWLVNVTCWGTVLIYDTEERAEGWRRHKANWEGCIARKKEVSPAEARDWLASREYAYVIDGEGNRIVAPVTAPAKAPAEELMCCESTCDQPADFEIRGVRPDGTSAFEDVTHACSGCVGALLGTPIGQPENEHWVVHPIVVAVARSDEG